MPSDGLPLVAKICLNCFHVVVLLGFLSLMSSSVLTWVNKSCRYRITLVDMVKCIKNRR